MKYYIDFDNTIFNTVLFYNDLENLMIKYGISKEDIYEYKEHHDIYDPIELIELILDDSKEDLIKNDINNLFKNNNYLYEDAINFLNKIKTNGDSPILFTYGSYHYQLLKINGTIAYKYFDDVIITSRPKYLENLDYENSVFIDDNPLVIKKLCLNNAKKVIRIKRDNNKYSKINLDSLNVLEYNNMNEILID